MTSEPKTLPAQRFVDALHDHDIQRVTGVPCGHLRGPWALFDRSGELIPAADEGAALAIAAGAELSGSPAAVLCQNSGFGNLINPLASLVLPYRIPVLVTMTLRGWPDHTADEPQHAVMGRGSEAILDNLGVPHQVLLPRDGDPVLGLADALDQAAAARSAGLPFFLLVPRDSIGPAHALPTPAAQDELTRPFVVSALLSELDDELLITTTGYLSRQAHHERDRRGTFYMQGSMGHAAAIGLGVAAANPHRRVVVLDGDGALLMHLGTASTIAAANATNLTHVVVDNGCYESTGCQPSTSSTVDWMRLGQGLGYATVRVSITRDTVAGDLRAALRLPGPALCVLRVRPTPNEVHPRASASAGLVELTDRFREDASRRNGDTPSTENSPDATVEVNTVLRG
jgi:phosphonopyruvate decarboxylase